jgi:lincosamide nucleotidyltransferase A/C/D/E
VAGARFEGMQLTEVLRVLDALAAAGTATWLEGGWGVDALVGRQTRAHRDVDVDIDAAHEAAALGVLHDLGYDVETDWRPNRVELRAAGRGWVDLHPLLLAPDGSARQPGLGGEVHDFPARWFTTGRLGDRTVGCFSLEAQRRFHTGYDLRPVDAHDLAQLDLLPGRQARAHGSSAAVDG